MSEPRFSTPAEDGPSEALDRPSASESQPGMLKSSAVMAFGTIVSRITGLVRNIALVAAIGFGTLSDAYSLGNTLPNIIYILIIGGALNAVFVPQLVRHFHHDGDDGQGYADRLLTLTAIMLLLLSVLSVLAAPWIVSLYAPDNYSQTDFDVAVAFTRFCLPQIFFYGIYTMLAQVLNSRGHFAMPMFAPIINNLVVIGIAITFIWVAGDTATMESITDAEIALLGIGTTAGVMFQALILIPVLKRVGYRYHPRFSYRGYGLTKTAILAGWTIGLVLVNQIGFVVTTRLATAANVNAQAAGVVAQGLTTYQNAYIMFMLPQSVITVSLVTALLPRLSRAAAEGRICDVASGISNGSRLVAALIIPSAGVLVAFGPIITSLFFNVGAGSGEAATYAGYVVSAFAIGLLPFALFYLFLRGWYSVEDTRTPFLVTVIFNVLLMAITIPLYFAVGPGVKVVSLAVSYTLAYWLILVIAWELLRRKLGGIHSRATIGVLSRMIVAGVCASALGYGAVVGFARVLSSWRGEEVSAGFSGTPLLGILALGVGMLVLGLSYIVSCRVLRVTEVTDALGMILGRLPILRRFAS